MKYSILIIILFFHSIFSFGQDEKIKDRYEKSYDFLLNMLNEKSKVDFKKAVFSTENAYKDGQLDTVTINRRIAELTSLTREFQKSHVLQYELKDKNEVEKWGAIFKVLTDTVATYSNGIIYRHLPFTYDFEDFFGEKDWSKMFVSKLLLSATGNCHSLPYLYKIIAEQLGTTAYLALAPNHIYIKHRSQKTGMYNTELTSATFPIDAWIMASGYIHLTAIQNGVFMKALNDKESIALCLIDLAEGYKRKTNNSDPDFIIKCSDKALEYFPNYVNALILKAETIKSQHDKLVVDNPNPTNEIKLTTQGLFSQMQDLYVKVHKLGYRQMPKDMYMKWLIELKTEKEKYQNKSVSSYDK